MEIRAIPFDRPAVLTSSVTPARPPAAEHPADEAAKLRPVSEGPAPAPAPGTSVRIQIHRPEPGVNIARVVDERTGEVLSQIPPEQVLNVVAEIVDSIRRREVH